MCSNIKLIDQNVEWVKGGAGGGGAGGGGAHRFIHKNGEKVGRFEDLLCEIYKW